MEMEAIKRIMKIPKNHEVKIKVPDYLLENETVEVILIVRKKSDDFEKKINELKNAMNDDLFLKDLNDISRDFDAIDLETWNNNNGI
ncbi:MAG: hypothetical protein AAB116_19965 [Candidatus Poribacteria bacterium]